MPDPGESSKQEASNGDKFVAPPISAYKYKFHDKGFWKDYHDIRMAYPVWETLPIVEQYKAHPLDICIATHPKAGTKFMSAVVRMIMHDGDPKILSLGHLQLDVPFLEFCTPGMPVEEMPAYRLNRQEPPRVFVTHLSYEALPQSIKEKARIIYVARNPKDLMVSANFFYRSMPFVGYDCTIEETAKDYITRTCNYGSFYDHVAGYRKHLAEMSNLFFTTYEDMLQDLQKVVVQLAKFLRKNLNEEQIRQIVHHCSFQQMKDNKMTNLSVLADSGHMDFSVSPFMRKGQVGNWKEHFSPELNEEVDKWITDEEQRLSKELSGFRFQFE